jgi:hypothetical protein
LPFFGATWAAVSFVLVSNWSLSLVEFGRDPCQISQFPIIQLCPSQIPCPFCSPFFAWPKRILPLTDLEFAVYIRHLAEYVPLMSPLGRKHILTLLDLPRECVLYSVFSLFLCYCQKAFLPLSEHTQYVLHHNIQYPFKGPPRILLFSMLVLLATLNLNWRLSTLGQKLNSWVWRQIGRELVGVSPVRWLKSRQTPIFFSDLSRRCVEEEAKGEWDDFSWVRGFPYLEMPRNRESSKWPIPYPSF